MSTFDGRAPIRTSEPWLEEAAAIAKSLATDVDQGLSAGEALARLDQYGLNRLDPAASVPKWRKLLAQFRDPLTYLLIGAVLVSFLAWLLEGAEGLPFEVLVIASIILINGVLGYIQEARAEQAVATLQR